MRVRYILPCVILLAALIPAHGNAAAGGKNTLNRPAAPWRGSQVRPAVVGQDEYGAILDRMGQEKKEGYLASLRRINAGLRNEHAALAKNYTSYSFNYRRTKQDLENRRATPYYVLKKMQDLEAEKERMETGIKTRETEKTALEAEVLATFRDNMPREFAEEWNKEEAQYAEYLNAIYRQVGWWMQIEYSPQWQNDESRLWDYLRQYYQDHPEELDILK